MELTILVLIMFIAMSFWWGWVLWLPASLFLLFVLVSIALHEASKRSHRKGVERWREKVRESINAPPG